MSLRNTVRQGRRPVRRPAAAVQRPAQANDPPEDLPARAAVAPAFNEEQAPEETGKIEPG